MTTKQQTIRCADYHDPMVAYNNPQEHKEWLEGGIKDFKDAGLYNHAARKERELKQLKREYDFPLMRFEKAGEELVDNLNLILK